MQRRQPRLVHPTSGPRILPRAGSFALSPTGDRRNPIRDKTPDDSRLPQVVRYNSLVPLPGGCACSRGGCRWPSWRGRPGSGIARRSRPRRAPSRQPVPAIPCKESLASFPPANHRRRPCAGCKPNICSRASTSAWCCTRPCRRRPSPPARITSPLCTPVCLRVNLASLGGLVRRPARRQPPPHPRRLSRPRPVHPLLLFLLLESPTLAYLGILGGTIGGIYLARDLLDRRPAAGLQQLLAAHARRRRRRRAGLRLPPAGAAQAARASSSSSPWPPASSPPGFPGWGWSS